MPKLALVAVILCACSPSRPAEVSWVTLRSDAEEVIFDRGFIGGIGASPDGTIFVFADSGFYRSAPSGQLPFERLSDLRPQGAWPNDDLALPGSWIRDAYAPSRDIVFAASRSVWRWEHEQGWERVASGRRITRDQMMKRCDHCAWTSDRAGIQSVWGRSPDDVYAVGGFASIIHFDGSVWTEEDNPLIPYVDSTYAAGMDSPQLTSVAGNATTVYAVSGRHLLRDRGDGWELIARPNDEEWKYCGLLSVVATEAHVLVAGGAKTCFARFDGSEWQLLASQHIRGMDYPLYGVPALDGSAVFHAPHASPFVSITEDGITGYRLPDSPGYGAGVMLTNSYVYVATRTQLLRYRR